MEGQLRPSAARVSAARPARRWQTSGPQLPALRRCGCHQPAPRLFARPRHRYPCLAAQRIVQRRSSSPHPPARRARLPGVRGGALAAVRGPRARCRPGPGLHAHTAACRCPACRPPDRSKRQPAHTGSASCPTGTGGPPYRGPARCPTARAVPRGAWRWSTAAGSRASAHCWWATHVPARSGRLARRPSRTVRRARSRHRHIPAHPLPRCAPARRPRHPPPPVAPVSTVHARPYPC